MKPIMLKITQENIIEIPNGMTQPLCSRQGLQRQNSPLIPTIRAVLENSSRITTANTFQLFGVFKSLLLPFRKLKLALSTQLIIIIAIERTVTKTERIITR